MIIFTAVVLVWGLAAVGVEASDQQANAKIEINNLNFKEVKLRDAFRALADIANMNVITDDSVSDDKKVTLQLTNITFFEAVELLARTNNLDYKIVNNTVLIAEPGNLRKGFQEKETKVFKLQNAEPKAIKESITSIVDEKSIKVDERAESLIITAYEGQLEKVRTVIKSLDKAKQQIVIQARIEEVSHDGLKELGIDWDFGDLKVSAGGSDSDSGGANLEVGNVKLSYSSMLNMLEENNQATVLANPQITTIDGKQANINIGDEVPIVRSGTDGAPKVNFKDVGINLTIKPQITEKNQVFINVTPEVSVVSKYIETQGGKYPVVSSRKAQTNVKVESGETIALGGLIKEEEMEKMSKVPVLGNLPVLGKLFQKKNTRREKRELIIFLTPEIIGEKKVVSSESEQKGSDKSGSSIGSSQVEPGIVSIGYKVKEDETLWGIGQKFNIFYAKIMRANNLRSKGEIKAGQTLEVPVPKRYYYRVKKGDTIEEIASKYNIKPERIKDINGISSLDDKYGMKLVLPVKVKDEDWVVDFSKDKEEYRKHMDN